MSETRTPVLRRPTPADELAKLHPIERGLYRLFEFFSSLKLALVLLSWLIIELTIGTFIESQVNAGAAKFFVYSSRRFEILLALLALNILCAALIRFPWKRYQTGFVVTHVGLLVILAGSMITALRNLDALMSVPQGKTESTYIDPDKEVIFVGYVDPAGKLQRETFPVSFGPLTWGHKIFGRWPWREGRKETFRLKNGDMLTVDRFLAQCEPQQNFVPSKESGTPAVQFRLYHPARADMTQWIVADREGMMASQSMGMGSVIIWRLDSPAELDHFLKAAPLVGAPMGLLGKLGVSTNGQHQLLDVDELKKKPLTLDDKATTVTLLEYLPSARLKDNRWISEGDEPNNPLLRLKVDGPRGSREYLAFGDHPEYGRLLAQRFGKEHLVTYFPADAPATIHLGVTPDGALAYRAFGSKGIIACALVEENKEYPSWAGLNFVPKKVLGQAVPQTRLIARPIKKGKPGNPGVALTLTSGKEELKVSLARGMRSPQTLAGRQILIGYDVQESKLPFEIRLDEFDEPKNPGTMQAAMYTSKVTLFDKPKGIEKQIDITMNEPLRYVGSDGIQYTLYQSGIDHSTGAPISTYTVANDPGLPVKYAGAIILCTGIFLMFFMGGYFKAPSKKARKTTRKQGAEEVEPQLAVV